MHFIGNRAIILDNGSQARQIMYSSAFTALSFFLPIIVLLKAFYLLGSTSTAKPLFIILAGILTGAAVCGMHYIGDYGISNYHCSYQTGNVVGSAIIAVAASLVALSIFFRLREMWTDSWWKRALCAAILAGAVSGMHWTAAVGTIYSYRGNQSMTSGTNRTQTVIICAALSLAACLLLLVVVVIREKKVRVTRTRAQQLVLACAYFDDNGRVMLTPEGALPCQKITNRFVEKTFGEDELSRSHPTFMWVFRASRNWPALKELISGMIDHLDADPAARKYTPGHCTPSINDDSSEVSVNFSAIFKQLFCVAAQQLANVVHEPLEMLGVLFEEPLETGVAHLTRGENTYQSIRNFSHSSRQVDVENEANGPFAFGRGKYLFLNRRLGKAEVAKFAALGYRFGSIQQVSELLARNMEVSNTRMKSRLDRMKICSCLEHLPPPGVHLACFMLRPSIYKSFDVLVPEQTQNQLPYTSMQLERLNEWQSALLQRFDEWTIKEILRTLINESGSLEPEREFRWQLHSSFIRIIDIVGDTDTMMNAVFSAKQIQTPSRLTEGTTGPTFCTLVTVRLMNTIHAKAEGKDMTYIPLSFFSAQQQIDTLGPNHEGFTRRLKMEFGYQPTNSFRKSAPTRNSFNDSRRESRDGTRPSSLLAAIGVSTPVRSSRHVRKSGEEHMMGTAMQEEKERSKGGSENNVDDMETVLDLDRASPIDSDFGNLKVPVVGQKNGDVEMVVLPEMEEKAGWVSDLFALFRL